MKIGNRLRDLLLKENETLMINKSSAEYYGEKYTFKPVSKSEVIANLIKLRELLK
jgi:hypothetical protein